MGVFVIVVMMLYSFGLCRLLQRLGQRSAEVRYRESEWNCPVPSIAIPDRVPAEWVDTYRAERGG